MDACSYDARRFFLLGMRFSFGVWLLYVGLMKWFMFGPAGFVGMITGEFDKTWSPHALNVFLAWVILVAEPLLAAWILTGKNARAAWSATAALMFMLVIGQTILMKPDVIANWEFFVATLACAALSEPREHRAAA